MYQNDMITHPLLDEAVFAVAGQAGKVLLYLDGETAHLVTIQLGKLGLMPREHRPDSPMLRTTLWGRQFGNPIGLAAGFDKNGECIDTMLAMGFGFVEIGSVTPKPQPGNPTPRVFRLPELGGIINRYGFNSQGVEAVRGTLAARATSRRAAGLLGVNLGKNKTTSAEDAAADYAVGIKELSEFADYLVVNISSPNTPGLRALQSKESLVQLVREARRARDAVRWDCEAGPPPILVKIAPDLTAQDKKDIAEVALAERVDGLIVSNTTIARPPEVSAHANGGEGGGLSGGPLMAESTALLSEMYRLTKGKVALVGGGGVTSGADAYAKIRAGASIVQLYTALVYQGATLLPNMKRELVQLLEADGFSSVAEAVGADHRL